jgi:hypothetical protein
VALAELLDGVRTLTRGPRGAQAGGPAEAA